MYIIKPEKLHLNQMLEKFPQSGKAMRLHKSQVRAKPHGLRGNLVYHHTPDCNECFFFILPNDRLVCVGYDAMVKRAK